MYEHHFGTVFQYQVCYSTVGQGDSNKVFGFQSQNLMKIKKRNKNHYRAKTKKKTKLNCKRCSQIQKDINWILINIIELLFATDIWDNWATEGNEKNPRLPADQHITKRRTTTPRVKRSRARRHNTGRQTSQLLLPWLIFTAELTHVTYILKEPPSCKVTAELLCPEIQFHAPRFF